MDRIGETPLLEAKTVIEVQEHLRTKIEQGTARVAVIGLGYVGLPLAVGFARRGFPVAGLEDNPERVDMLNRGFDYIDGRHQAVGELVSSGRLRAGRDYAVLESCDAIIICVPTPLTRHREPDISHVQDVSVRIGRHIRPGTLVVLESTTFPGTTEEVVRPAIEAGGRVSRVGVDYFLAFSPERVDPGNPDYNTYNTTKVVGGVTPVCSELTRALYASMLDHPDLVKVASSPAAAEMEKLFENIFRSVNIALVNELALLCKSMGLDVWEILDLAATKPFGFMRFDPGPGIGGHCIPLDPYYLTWKAREYDFRTRFIELAGEINTRMPYHVLELVREALGGRGLVGSRVLVLGVAYKRDVADHRESPALKLLDLLAQKGARPDYHDPLIPEVKLPSGRILRSVPLEGLQSYDCVVLTTDHSVFDVPALVREARLLVDTRGVTRGLDGLPHVYRLGSPAPRPRP
jgi:UDP-N-acetyl-D-glucosamine dehydrogenase